jgi:hypothetical protein
MLNMPDEHCYITGAWQAWTRRDILCLVVQHLRTCVPPSERLDEICRRSVHDIASLLAFVTDAFTHVQDFVKRDYSVPPEVAEERIKAYAAELDAALEYARAQRTG